MRFGLEMAQPDYNLFVLGEVGSGRSSLLRQAMQEAATRRPTPPDLCYLHHFDGPERPRALRLPAGQGRLLRRGMTRLVQTLIKEIPEQLDSAHARVEGERLEKNFKEEEAKAYGELDGFAESRDFALHRDADRLLFTLRGPEGRAMTEDEMLALPRERRADIARLEQELLAEINRYLERVRPLEQSLAEELADLRRRVVRPLIDRQLREVREELKKQIKDSVKLGAWLNRVKEDILDGLELFQPAESDDAARREALAALVARYRVNLVVDNHDLEGAPVIVEDNPLFRSLFGSIEYQSENDVLVTDFSRIRAGSLHRAHGGFLRLHLRDLGADGLVWEKLRRFLRSGRLQIEEPGTTFAPVAAVSLEPEPVDADVKIVLITSPTLLRPSGRGPGVRPPIPGQGGLCRAVRGQRRAGTPRRCLSPVPARGSVCRISPPRQWPARRAGPPRTRGPRPARRHFHVHQGLVLEGACSADCAPVGWSRPRMWTRHSWHAPGATTTRKSRCARPSPRPRCSSACRASRSAR